MVYTCFKLKAAVEAMVEVEVIFFQQSNVKRYHKLKQKWNCKLFDKFMKNWRKLLKTSKRSFKAYTPCKRSRRNVPWYCCFSVVIYFFKSYQSRKDFFVLCISLCFNFQSMLNSTLLSLDWAWKNILGKTYILFVQIVLLSNSVTFVIFRCILLYQFFNIL